VGEPVNTTQTPAQRTESRRSESYTRNYEIGKEVSVSRSAIGRIERVSVAIVLRANKNIKPANIAAIEQLVRNTVGFDDARGDKISVSVQPFAAVPLIPAPAWYANEDVRKYVPVIVAAVLVVLISLLVIRPQLKKMSELAAAPAEQTDQDQHERTYKESSATAGQAYDEKLMFIKQFVTQDHVQASNILHRLLTTAEQKV
jgi:flagellar M-ring protein FliF